ncbi:polyprenol monophosphomannose synthase [Rubripirellula obstinata]|uniref:polyprenol monophosphomannose synthase n=1 Tax=Rubripirellula obstinata TaxID=406547 RepID=UPI001F2D59B2|nr:polyprenol monophosphomannose synthase [Rubripirellula obstinata]
MSADTQPQSDQSPATQFNPGQTPANDKNGFGKILVGICTLNESKNIESLIHQVRGFVPEADILIVDDDSEDGTSAIVSKLAESDTKLTLNVRKQRGLGGAIRHAMVAAIKGEYDLFINMDGDLSHSPSDLPAMLEAHAGRDDIDVVIGSRYVSGGKIDGWPLHRRLMSRLVNRFATLCLGLPVRDCSGSMRCYRVSALRDASATDLESNGYSILEEILVAMHRGGSTMTEVPITFTDRTQGESKLTLREATRSMIHMVKLSIR